MALTCVRLHSVVRGGHFLGSQRPSCSTHASIPCTWPSRCHFYDHCSRDLSTLRTPAGNLYYLRRFRTFRCARVVRARCSKHGALSVVLVCPVCWSGCTARYPLARSPTEQSVRTSMRRQLRRHILHMQSNTLEQILDYSPRVPSTRKVGVWESGTVIHICLGSWVATMDSDCSSSLLLPQVLTMGGPP